MRLLCVSSILCFILGGCGRGEDGCDFGFTLTTSTIALEADGGAIGATPCMAACESHAGELCTSCASGQVGFAIESCGYVSLDGGTGVRCTFRQESIGCP
jgi:hypothetical protein